MSKITNGLFVVSLLTLSACAQTAAPVAEQKTPVSQNTTASQTIAPAAENTTASQTITAVDGTTVDPSTTSNIETETAIPEEVAPASNVLINESFGFSLTLPTGWNKELLLTSDTQIGLEDGFEAYGVDILAPKLSADSSRPDYEALGRVILVDAQNLAKAQKSENKDYYGFLSNKLGGNDKYTYFFDGRNLKTFNQQFPIYQFTAKDFKLNQ